jgi:manganese/zinc/iron transport system permease protein
MLQNVFLTFFSDHTLQVVVSGSIILGVTAGCLGAFAVLRQQSLLGDAISHATLPGIGLAFLLTQNKSPLILLLGAALAGWLGTIFVKIVTDMTRIKRDTALGIVLSVFFGFGLVLITIIQRLPTATKAGLDKFLFGNAATLLTNDVVVMAILSSVVFVFLLLFWKEFKLLIFDKEYAHSLGMAVHFFDILLTTLIVLAIVLGLQTVGVVLMSAMLVAPAASARQWTDHLGVMVILSAVFGALSGVAGSVTSSMIAKMPTGPTIVVYLSMIVLFSLLFAPHRGLLWDWARTRRHRKEIHTTAMLKNLLLFAENHADPFHPHDIAALNAIGRAAIHKTMQELARKGWAKQYPDKRWALTPNGLSEVERLTESYEKKFKVHLEES